MLAEKQNLFFVELVAALREELGALGVDTRTVTGRFPPANQSEIYVLVPPHEWFRLEGRLHPPGWRTLRSTIFICAEQPGTPFFEEDVRLSERAGAVFDINPSGVRALRDRGISARHLPLGYTQSWDHYDRQAERDIDLLFYGTPTDRRNQALAEALRHLWRYETHLILASDAGPQHRPGPRFVVASEKAALLARSKVVLNLHRSSVPYFEWLRVMEAIQAGAVVVTEHSVDIAPLVPGRHVAVGRAKSLGFIAASLLSQPGTLATMRDRAYDFVKTTMPLSAAARELADAANALAPAPRRRPSFPSAPTPASLPVLQHHLTVDTDHLTIRRHLRLAPDESLPPATPKADKSDIAIMRAALKDLRLEVMGLRRQEVDRSSGREADAASTVASASYEAAAPDISVVVTVHNYASVVVEALSSAAAAVGEGELVIVDDASTDDSVEVVSDWIAQHPEVPALHVRRTQNRGLPRSRNEALEHARGSRVFVLDADNFVYPNGIARLQRALERDPDAAFAYGILERFSGTKPLGLMNFVPWEPALLRWGNLADAMALIDRHVLIDLGGFTTDPRLHGWEDYDLWCKLAEEGFEGAFVPQVVGRYRVSGHSMLQVTDISWRTAFSVLADRYPRVMGEAHDFATEVPADS